MLHIFRQGADTELRTDASSLGFGAIFLQKDDYGNLHPVHFKSKKTTPAQAKYSSYELEAFAVIEALKKFRTYLLGNKFKIVTDCSDFKKKNIREERSYPKSSEVSIISTRIRLSNCPQARKLNETR